MYINSQCLFRALPFIEFLLPPFNPAAGSASENSTGARGAIVSFALFVLNHRNSLVGKKLSLAVARERAPGDIQRKEMVRENFHSEISPRW
jgi:hypothetical protein